MSDNVMKDVACVIETLLLFVKKRVGFGELKRCVSDNWRSIMIFVAESKQLS